MGERELRLTRTTFDVLAVLLRSQGSVVTIEDLIREVWGYAAPYRPGFARTAVYRLRKELRAAGAGDSIEAIRGLGFRIAGLEPAFPPVAQFDPLEALASSAAAVFVVSRGHRMIWANRAAERLSGYTLEELRALSSTAELAAAIDPALYQRMRDDVRDGQTLVGPTRLRRRDGTVLETSASWRPVFDAAGAVEYSIVEMWVPDASATDDGSPTS